MKHFYLLLLCPQLLFTQWVQINTVPPNIVLASVSVPAADIVWLAGGPSNGTPVVWKSTNGGVNFTSAVGSGLLLDLFAIWAFDETNAFTGDGGGPNGIGGNAHVYRTTDGGTTWSVVLTTGGTAGFINGIIFSKANPQQGFVQSDPPAGPGNNYFIRVTSNGGSSWDSVICPGVTGQISQWNSVIFIDSTFFGFCLLTVPSVRLTSDGGANWNNYPTGFASGSITGLGFHNDKQTGVAASNNSLPSVSRTTNGGVNWSTFNSGTNITGYGVVRWVWGTNVFYAAGFTGPQGSVMRSTDGGVTWAALTIPAYGNQILNMDFVKDTNNVIWGYACTQNGRVFKLEDHVLIGINPNNNTVPVEYVLEQNYPNPFNPVTVINYSVPKSAFVTIKIHDLLGREVKTLVSKQHQTGNYTETFDGSSLSSGIYYYSMSAGDYKKTRKMIILK
jgi:photosystem II stability/assembly factor-like uncharacterized protein